MEKQPLWTLEQGLAIVRQLQPAFHAKEWHVALAGGVINKGFSHKDLDLVFLPFHGAKPLPYNDVLDLLRANGYFLDKTWNPREKGGPSGSEYIWSPYRRQGMMSGPDGKRIDIFIV